MNWIGTVLDILFPNEVLLLGDMVIIPAWTHCCFVYKSGTTNAKYYNQVLLL